MIDALLKSIPYSEKLLFFIGEEGESQVKQTIKKGMLNNDDHRAIHLALIAKNVNGKLKREL